MSLDNANEKVDFLTEEDGIIYDLDEYDDNLEFEIELSDSEFNTVQLLYELYLKELSKEELLEAVYADRKIELYEDDKPITIRISRRSGTANTEGREDPQHGPRIKIIKPSDMKVSITIPSKELVNKGKSAEIIGNYDKKYEKDIKFVQKFVNDNRYQLFNIFDTSNDYNAKRAFKTIIRKNNVKLKKIADNDELYFYCEKIHGDKENDN